MCFTFDSSTEDITVGAVDVWCVLPVLLEPQLYMEYKLEPVMTVSLNCMNKGKDIIIVIK